MSVINHPLTKKILRDQAVLIGIAIVISLVQGGLTLSNIGSFWALIGFFVLVFGLMSGFGSWSSVRSGKYQMMLSNSGNDDQRRAHTSKEMNSTLFFVFSTFGNALISIVGGLALFLLFG